MNTQENMQKKYYSTPEAKERKRKYDRQRYLKNKRKN